MNEIWSQIFLFFDKKEVVYVDFGRKTAEKPLDFWYIYILRGYLFFTLLKMSKKIYRNILTNEIIKDGYKAIFDQDGFDQYGYDKDGIDRRGFNMEGIHNETKDYFDLDGLDEWQFDREGINQHELLEWRNAILNRGECKKTDNLFNVPRENCRVSSTGVDKITKERKNPVAYDLFDYLKKISKWDFKLKQVRGVWDNNFSFLEELKQLEKEKQSYEIEFSEKNKEKEGLENKRKEQEHKKKELENKRKELENKRKELENKREELIANKRKEEQNKLYNALLDRTGKKQKQKHKDQKKIMDTNSSTIADIDTKIVDIDSTMTDVDTKIIGIDAKIGGINTTIADIDAKIGGINTTIADIDAKIGGINTKISKLKSESRNFKKELEMLVKYLWFKDKELFIKVFESKDIESLIKIVEDIKNLNIKENEEYLSLKSNYFQFEEYLA